MLKTHTANVTMAGLPAFHPPELTQRGIYVVRDPRSVVLSMSSFFGISLPKAVEQMNNLHFQIGDVNGLQTPQMVSSWSNNVKSWVASGQTVYPVAVIRYEDMMENPLKELREVMEFLGLEFDEDRGVRAVEATELSRLSKVEDEKGFEEYKHKDRGKFFNKGGTRWKDELGPKFIKQIEADHGEVMQELGYALEY